MVLLAEAEPVVITAEIDEDFKISPQQLGAAISDKTRLLILNNPSNPTGVSYSQAELKALGEVLEQYPQIVIAADEIYEPIHWADDPFVSFAAACPDLLERTVTVNGVSKAYAMTGWRIGYAAGPQELIEAMKTIQSQSTTNPCSVSQVAEYRSRHDYLVAALNDIPGFQCRPGEGTFYAFPRVDVALKHLGLADDVELTEHLINSANVAVVPGSAFGAPGYLRLSFACSMESLKEAVGRIKRSVTA